MKRVVSLILILTIGLSLAGCVDKKAIAESVKASVNESVKTSQEVEAIAAQVESDQLKKAAVAGMVGDFDCFAVGETATLADLDFAVVKITSLGPQKKATGKMSDYTIKVDFTISNNSKNTYIPRADMRLIVNGDLIQSHDTNPESAERADYDAGVASGQTKTFSNTFFYNLSDPADNIVVARWAPFSSSVPQDTLVVYFDINPELEAALQQ